MPTPFMTVTSSKFIHHCSIYYIVFYFCSVCNTVCDSRPYFCLNTIQTREKAAPSPWPAFLILLYLSAMYIINIIYQSFVLYVKLQIHVKQFESLYCLLQVLVYEILVLFKQLYKEYVAKLKSDYVGVEKASVVCFHGKGDVAFCPCRRKLAVGDGKYFCPLFRSETNCVYRRFGISREAACNKHVPSVHRTQLFYVLEAPLGYGYHLESHPPHVHEQKIDCQRPVVKTYEENCFRLVNQLDCLFYLFNAYSAQKFLEIIQILLGNLKTHVS